MRTRCVATAGLAEAAGCWVQKGWAHASVVLEQPGPGHFALAGCIIEELVQVGFVICTLQAAWMCMYAFRQCMLGCKACAAML